MSSEQVDESLCKVECRLMPIMTTSGPRKKTGAKKQKETIQRLRDSLELSRKRSENGTCSWVDV